MMRRLTTIIGAGVLVFLMIQLVPRSTKNPPVTQDVAAPPQVESILRRACYDCHSNATRWPWYAHVAPVSWTVVRDVERGRNHLNFSTWDKYADDPETVIRKLRNIDKVMHNGTMPLWYYLPEHPRARLGDADREASRIGSMQSHRMPRKSAQGAQAMKNAQGTVCYLMALVSGHARRAPLARSCAGRSLGVRGLSLRDRGSRGGRAGDR